MSVDDRATTMKKIHILSILFYILLSSCSQKTTLLKQYRSSVGKGSYDYVVGVLIEDKKLDILETILKDVKLRFYEKNGNSFSASHAQFPKHKIGYIHLKLNNQLDRKIVIDYIKKTYSKFITSCDLLYTKKLKPKS